MSILYFKMLLLVTMLIFYDTQAVESGSCDAISSSLTATKIGQKSWDKCIEYQEKYVYPCEESSVPGARPQRADYCKQDSVVQNDTDSADNKFNYVVSVGFGTEDNMKWFSGGTIVSEKYIVTCAHSMQSPNFGTAKFVYLGTPVDNKDIDPSRLYKIKTILRHPDYKSPSKYHDIALIETEVLLKLNKYIRPACLHTGEALNYDEASLISRNFGYPKDVIEMKVTKLSNEECSNNFRIHRHLIIGYTDDWQMCYENNNDLKYTRFDGGCPLQVKSDKIKCMNIVIGVTSFGSGPSLTVYTRVSHYLPWIESVVWP